MDSVYRGLHYSNWESVAVPICNRILTIASQRTRRDVTHVVMPPKRAPNSKLHQLAVELPLNTIISDSTTKKQYCVGRQFATGGFGRIYTCTEVGSKTELVVKVEPYGNGPLFTEMNVFIRILKKEQIEEFMKSRNLKRLGVPKIISCGIYTHGKDKLRFLVIPKYATSLEAIREKSKTLSARDVWAVTRSILESLEYIHDKNYTHADIKAANILLERTGDFTSSVLVDFGLARLSSSNEDKPDKKRAHNGTAIFTSCDAHRGCHPSYRGDLEILAYNILYWLNGSLPWEAFEANPSKIYELKQAFLNDLTGNLKKLLQNNLESVAPLQEIFSIACKTGYSEHLVFPKLYKIADEALKRVGATGHKRIAKECAGDVVESKKKKMSSRDKQATSSKGRRTGKEEEKSEDSVEVVAPPTPRLVRFRKKVAPTPTTSATIPEPRRSPRARDRAAESSLSSQAQLARQTPSVAARDRRRAAIKAHSAEISARLPSGEVIPGLSVRRAPCSQLDVESNVPSGDTNGTPTEKNRKRPGARVSSDVKRSPTKLRKIPGMLNFQRGRRSIIIDQITKKYQKIAEKKRRSREVNDE
ncbi:hypothetical protein RB195_020019 [Necator americanus]|uniref:non-specific serine/threonine protein kinase n=1 Tax=Necator americanus TaxID=51031 RepID=A0ABR1CIQ6_NECAM